MSRRDREDCEEGTGRRLPYEATASGKGDEVASCQEGLCILSLTHDGKGDEEESGLNHTFSRRERTDVRRQCSRTRKEKKTISHETKEGMPT